MTSWKEDYPLDDLLYSLKEISNFLTGEGREDEEGRGLRESREKTKRTKNPERERLRPYRAELVSFFFLRQYRAELVCRKKKTPKTIKLRFSNFIPFRFLNDFAGLSGFLGLHLFRTGLQDFHAFWDLHFVWSLLQASHLLQGLHFPLQLLF